MNDKDKEMNRIIEAVIEACTTTISESEKIYTISREDVLGKCKRENANITRTMLATHLIRFGLSHTTISMLFGKSVQAIRNMEKAHTDYLKLSKAYRIAHAQVIRKLEESNDQESARVTFS